MKFCRMLAMVVCLCCCTSRVFGATPPPPLPDMGHVPATLSFPMVSISLGRFNVSLEQTPLAAIRDVIGVGAIQHARDAASSQHWLCYTSSMGGMPARIWIASGELGGVERIVDSFYAVATDKQATPDCPALPSAFLPISLGKVPALGSGENELEYAFGKASARDDGWLFYSGVTSSHDRDRIAFLGARVSDGRIDSLFISQATTN